MIDVKELEAFLIAYRHELHRHPELSNEEFDTTLKIQTVLEKYQIEQIETDLPTGVFAKIEGGLPGPTVALRADIDALPITEETDLPYKSTKPGVMHACGHDFHISVILGAALLLNEKKASLKGTIILLFQAAEETGVGARKVLESGILNKTEAVFGFHNDPSLPVGVLGTKTGALTAGVDRFVIRIHGKGAHGAKPNEGNDPAIILAQIIQAFQPIVSRNLKPDAHAVVSITQVHSGSTWNVIPAEAFLEGTARTFSPEDRQKVEERIRTIITGIAVANDARIEIDWFASAPSVLNTEEWVDLALEVSREVGYDTRIVKESAIGEDFAYYQEEIPGVFVMIGSGGPYDLHHSKFQIDDQALPAAVQFFEKLITRVLS